MIDRELFDMAKSAREGAYVPYSGFKVGAALLCDDGTLYTGCNIENASYGVTVCAERVALFKAVADGKRAFVAIAVAGGERDKPLIECFPCGICRQALSEFCEKDFRIILGEGDELRSYTLEELLPHGFTLD